MAQKRTGQPSGGDPADPERSVELLRMAQAGDEQACNDLLARYLPRLQRWASRRLPMGGRSMLDSGDVVQDAIVATLRHLNSIEVRTDNAFEIYVKRAIRNRIIDIYRRPKRIRRELDEGVPARDPSPLDEVIGREAFERYEAATAELSDSDCQLIVMHTEMGLSTAEIAEELDKSPDAARMGVTRALKRLAEAMERLA